MVWLNRLECMVATYLHEETPVVPQEIGFTDDVTTRKLAPELLTITDARKRFMASAKILDHFSMGCGGGGIQEKVVKACPEYMLVETELGMVKKQYRLKDQHQAAWRPAAPSERADIRTLHNWTEIVKHPIERKEDLAGLEMPDPDDPSRYEGVEENVEWALKLGYLPVGGINGFFANVWYNFLPFNLWLRAMVRDRLFAEKLAALNGEFNLRAGKNLLERGVECLQWGDDMGYKKGMFFSREVYKALIWPWHKKAAELAHRYGAFAEMHTDGNINAIMDLIVDAGIDAINHVGPGDNMDLAELKEKYGDRLTLHGGLSRFTSQMTPEQLRAHIIDRLAVGSPGGGYILGQEGAIHSDMSPETFRFMMEYSRKHRRNQPTALT